VAASVKTYLGLDGAHEPVLPGRPCDPLPGNLEVRRLNLTGQ